MHALAELLASQPYLVTDGAMGTMLMAAGLVQGAAPEGWNVAQPERVRAVHRQYIEAGAQIVLTNSFGGSRFRLKLHKWQDRVAELNQAAAELARLEAANAERPVLVAGSMGPSGELLAPVGTLAFEAARDGFAEQAAALAAGGVDLLWIETMSDPEELRAGVEGARSVCDRPIVTTMTFDTHGRTMMGITPQQGLAWMRDLGAAALGANCGNGPAEIEQVIHAMHAADPAQVLVAKSNAGIPRFVRGSLSYDGTPEVMAEYALRARALGAQLIGACCGSTPAHIRAMAEALASGRTVDVSDVGNGEAGQVGESQERRQRRHRRSR